MTMTWPCLPSGTGSYALLVAGPGDGEHASGVPPTMAPAHDARPAIQYDAARVDRCRFG
jgi:hypothetical protein